MLVYSGLKPRRFFFHFNKQTRNMTVHVAGQCIPVRHVSCHVPVQTKYNKRQPYLVLQGFARLVEVHGEIALIR